AYVRDHYQRNAAYYIGKALARNRIRRHLLLDQILAFLCSHPCVDCGEGDPVVLDFDHLNPTDKRWNIADKVTDGSAWPTILAEIEKCAVRCANCHRRRTAHQFGWYRLSSAVTLPAPPGLPVFARPDGLEPPTVSSED